MLTLSTSNPNRPTNACELHSGILLLVAGTLIGLNFSLAKLAGQAGI